MVSPVFQAGTSFLLKLAYDRHPLEGLRLQVTLDGDPAVRQSAITDQEGFAPFHNLRPGSYALGVDDNLGISTHVGLDVRNLGPPEITVPLTSLNAFPVPARSLKGILHAPDGIARPQAPPAVNVGLDLFDSSGAMLKSTATSATGSFSFDDVNPGFYFIKIRPSMTLGSHFPGTIVVDVDPHAAGDHLDLALNHTDCGFMYSDVSQCARSELRLSQLHGWVADITGASVSKANVVLVDSKDKIVEQTRSDDWGRFALSHSVPGTYQLVVHTNGFAVSRTTVHLEPTGDLSAKSPIEIQLGLAGSCSAAYVH